MVDELGQPQPVDAEFWVHRRSEHTADDAGPEGGPHGVQPGPVLHLKPCLAMCTTVALVIPCCGYWPNTLQPDMCALVLAGIPLTLISNQNLTKT